MNRTIPRTNRGLTLGSYSLRSTTSGSTDAARRAGTTAAASETSTRMRAAVPRLTTSVGDKPKRSPSSVRRPGPLTSPHSAWPATRAELEKTLEKHALARAELMGRNERSDREATASGLPLRSYSGSGSFPGGRGFDA